MEICPPYISKLNANCEKQIIVLMIPKEEKECWHYLSVKKISVLLRRIISKKNNNSCCLNYSHSSRTKSLTLRKSM